MDSRIITQSILTAPREVLAAQLALLDEATLAALLKSKATDTFSDEKGSFNRAVEGAANRLMKESPAELALRLMGALNEILEVPPRRYAAPRDFEDNAGEILTRCLAVLRDTEKDFSGNNLQDLLRFLTNRMFGEIGKRFESLDAGQQQQVVDAVRAFITDLPEAQREKIRNEIGADQITDSYIRKAIVSGTLSTAFATVVSVGGFAFYTGAVSLLATLAGLVGLTLPFSVYVGLTSTIAVVANPLFFVPVVAGGGWWLYTRQNKAMRRRLAPLVVAQAVLNHVGRSAVGGEDHLEEALGLWQVSWSAVVQSRAQLAEVERRLANTREELSRTGDTIRQLKRRYTRKAADVGDIEAGVRDGCAAHADSIAFGEWGEDVASCGRDLQARRQAVRECRARPARPGIGGIADRAARWLASLEAERQATAAADQLLHAVLGTEGRFPPPIIELLRRRDETKAEQRAITAELAENRRKEATLLSQETAERHTLTKRRAERNRAESRYWGLSEIK